MILLIGGHQRSGTGMLTDLLNSHPRIHISKELASFDKLDVSWRICLLWGLYRLWVMGGYPFHHGTARGPRSRMANLFYMGRYLGELRRQQRDLVDLAAVSRTLEALHPEARVVGDKYPDYVYSLDRYALSGQARVLIIYRDCRDVTASTLLRVRTRWRRRGFIRKLDSVEKIARRWVLAMELLDRYSDRVRRVCYEELVRRPGEVLPGLAKWLQVGVEGFQTGLLHTTSIRKHRSLLSDPELETISRIAGPTMAHLGYR